MDIVSKSDYVEEEYRNTSCSIKFKTLPFTVKCQSIYDGKKKLKHNPRQIF